MYALINWLITDNSGHFLNFLGIKREKLQNFHLPFFETRIHFSVDSGEKVTQEIFKECSFCGIYWVTFYVASA